MDIFSSRKINVFELVNFKRRQTISYSSNRLIRKHPAASRVQNLF